MAMHLEMNNANQEQGEVPDLQDDIQHPVDSRDWRCESVLPEPKVSSEA